MGFDVYLSNPVLGELKISHVARQELFDPSLIKPFFGLYHNDPNWSWSEDWNRVIRDGRYRIEFEEDEDW